MGFDTGRPSALCALAIIVGIGQAMAQTASPARAADGYLTLVSATEDQRAARRLHQVRMAGELKALMQRMTRESFLLALGMGSDARSAGIDEAAWRFERVLGGFRRGDSSLGVDRARDDKLKTRVRAVAAAWNGYTAVIQEMQETTKITGDQVRGLVAARDWLDLELTDMDRRVQYIAFGPGVLSALPATFSMRDRREIR